MTMTDKTEDFARKLRKAAFPGARPWAFCAEDVRERWINAARHAESKIELAVDTTLREATAAAHGIGQHAAAKMLRQMRNGSVGETATGEEGK